MLRFDAPLRCCSWLHRRVCVCLRIMLSNRAPRGIDLPRNVGSLVPSRSSCNAFDTPFGSEKLVRVRLLLVA
jgi:hypothetical protein